MSYFKKKKNFEKYKKPQFLYFISNDYKIIIIFKMKKNMKNKKYLKRNRIQL